MIIKSIGTIIKHMSLITLVFTSYAVGEGFELIGSIPSNNGLYYTTMAPQGNFIAMGDQRSPGAGIDIINVENPEYMFEVGHVYTGHMTYQLAWSGNYIYSPASWDGFFIYNASNFENIFLIADTSFGEPLTTVAIHDNITLIGGVGNLYAINIENPNIPQVVWSTGSFGCSDMAIGDTIAYTYSIYEYVVILDISLPENPQEITRFNYQGVNDIEINHSERYLYLTAGDQGLIIFNIENPELPIFISSTAMPNGAFCIDICESEKDPNIVFISGYTGGLWAVDVSDPENPIPLDNYNSSLWSCYVISKQDVIFHTIADSMLALSYDYDNVSGVQDGYDNSIVEEFSLSQNHPNPFNAFTSIKFNLNSESEISITIYNINGQKVDLPFKGSKQAGEHTITWNADDFPSGVYFAKLEAGESSRNIKMLLLK